MSSLPKVVLAIDDLRLLRMEFQPTISQSRSDGLPHFLGLPFCAAVGNEVSSPGESHPEALSELYVSLSTHTAPIKEPRDPSASEQTVLESDGRYYRSSVMLAEDGDATFCICAWPKRQDRGQVRA